MLYFCAVLLHSTSFYQQLLIGITFLFYLAGHWTYKPLFSTLFDVLMFLMTEFDEIANLWWRSQFFDIWHFRVSIKIALCRDISMRGIAGAEGNNILLFSKRLAHNCYLQNNKLPNDTNTCQARSTTTTYNWSDENDL